MSREFVRNIKNTKIKGDKKEPLGTNLQNDLLSDDEDVAIRNQNDYHILTDNIKTITSANELLTVNKTGKNSVELDVKPSEDIDLTSYATKEYVDNEINDLDIPDLNDIEFPVTSVNGQTGDVDIEIPEVDLSDYAKTVDVEREINDTKLYIDTEIENIHIPEVDLSDYAKVEQLQDLTTKEYVDEQNTQTKVYVDNKIGNIDVPDVSDFATKEELNEHVDSKSNPHGLTKSQIGLGSVLNQRMATVIQSQSIQNQSNYVDVNLLNAGISYKPSDVTNIDLRGMRNYVTGNSSDNNFLEKFKIPNINELVGHKKIIIYKTIPIQKTFNLDPSFKDLIQNVYTNNTTNMERGIIEIDLFNISSNFTEYLMFVNFTSFDGTL